MSYYRPRSKNTTPGKFYVPGPLFTLVGYGISYILYYYKFPVWVVFSHCILGAALGLILFIVVVLASSTYPRLVKALLFFGFIAGCAISIPMTIQYMINNARKPVPEK